MRWWAYNTASLRPGGDINCSNSSGPSIIINTREPPVRTSFSQAVKSGTWKQTTRSAALTAASVPLHLPIVGTPTLVQDGIELTHISYTSAPSSSAAANAASTYSRRVERSLSNTTG